MTAVNYLIAVGASAGGLGPCEQFFDNAPTDEGIAYVVIQHLSPDFRSLMDELLARHSSMPIHRVEDGMLVEPNTIYLNRPRQNLKIQDGTFVVFDDEEDEVVRLPIDHFFETIADTYKEKAIAVILSGSGSDGLRGARHVKSKGGAVFAQSLDSAKFDSMPRAIISNELADGQAQPGELPALIARHIRGDEDLSSDHSIHMTEDPFQDILSLLKVRFGTDFSFYKTETLSRRLVRRRDLTRAGSLRDYFDLLLNDPDESEILYNDMLIEVTSFFRDKAAFDALEREVIPDICREMSRSKQVRVWVPGCASGEEAYSIAILVAEYAQQHNLHFNLKILATDIHRRSLSAASSGIFSEEQMASVSVERRKKFFVGDGDHYQVSSILRRSVVFSPHDLMSDPPFTRMDLVSCRNVMIYLTEEAQKKLLALFHFSLVKDGYLFLGPSETTGKLAREFQQISQRWRMFRKVRDVRLIESNSLLTSNTAGLHRKVPTPIERRTVGPELSNRELAASSDGVVAASMHQLLGVFAPPGFVIDRSGALLHIFGKAHEYLRYGDGAYSNSIISLLHDDLRDTAKTLIDRFMQGVNVRHFQETKLASGEGQSSTVRLVLTPLRLDDGESVLHAYMSVERVDSISQSFEMPVSSEKADLIAGYAARLSELEELQAQTEESLQATIEEMETSNEELQATNEELMSSNEELQSTNEELHSVNEELYTVSAEHERKIEELSEVTLDMDHLLKSTEIGTIFLDPDLRLRRFTPAASLTFNLIVQDIGRPFEHITAQFNSINTLELARRVQKTRKQIDREVVSNGRTYLMRILPYIVSMAKGVGVVITMIDIDPLKRARQQLVDIEKLHAEVIKDIGQVLVRWKRSDGCITYCNEPFADLFGADIAEILGKDISNVLSEEARTAMFGAAAEVAPEAFRRVTLYQPDAGGVVRYFDGMLRAISDGNGAIMGYQFTARDHTSDYDYIRALEEVLEVDRSDSPLTEKSAETENVEFARVEKLLQILKSYLDAEQLMVMIGAAGEEAKPLVLPAVRTARSLPTGAYAALEDLVPDDARSAKTFGFQKESSGARSLQQTLLSDLNASRAIVGPIISKNKVMGRVILAVPEGRRERAFTELELALSRIVIRWVGYIWERSRVFQAMLQRSEELRLLLDNVEAKIWYKDSHNRILQLNEAAARSMGKTVEEVTGADTYELFPEIAAKYHQDDLEVIETGHPKLGIIEEFKPLDGAHGWVRTDKFPYEDPATGEKNIIVIANDISETKSLSDRVEQLSQSLAQQRELYRKMFFYTPANMFISDTAGEVIDANAAFCATVGQEASEIVGSNLRALLPDAGIDDFIRSVLQADGETKAVSTRLTCRDGAELDVEVFGALSNLDDGTDSLIWVVQDVTSLKAAVAEVQDANATLQQQNDGLAQFAYAASHDLQEPLRKIRQFGDMLTEEYGDALEKDARFYVDVMTSSAGRMSALVKNLLQFSSASRIDLKPKAVRLRGLVDTALSAHETEVKAADAKVAFGRLPSVVCDAELVEIVFSNLISNALKYRHPDRSLVINVSSEAVGEGADRMTKISISDNGVGFDQGDSGRIFDPFVRLVAKNEVKGSGIGLAICRTICERHGWTISAEGRQGAGATVFICIPESTQS